MKKYYFIFIAVILTDFCWSNNIHSASKKCAPSFDEVYDFEVGDVFQYKKDSQTSSGGCGPSRSVISKYTIDNKSIEGDSILYDISGIRKTVRSSELELRCMANYPHDTTVNMFSEQHVFVDSASHFLNKCDGDIVEHQIFNRLFIMVYDSITAYTKVIIEKEDQMRTKVIGGRDNIYNIENDSVIKNFPYFEEKYGKNLGLIYRSISGFEFSESVQLQGYIKNGDTSGTITSDEDLQITSVKFNKLPENNKLQNIKSGIIYFKVGKGFNNNPQSGIYNVMGRRLLDKYGN